MARRKQVTETVYIRSRSSYHKEYEIKFYVDDTVWCPCPKYKFAKKVDGHKPECHHLAAARHRLESDVNKTLPVETTATNGEVLVARFSKLEFEETAPVPLAARKKVRTLEFD